MSMYHPYPWALEQDDRSYICTECGAHSDDNTQVCGGCGAHPCFPFRDDMRPNRRWNEDHTDYVDLRGCLAECENYLPGDNSNRTF